MIFMIFYFVLISAALGHREGHRHRGRHSQTTSSSQSSSSRSPSERHSERYSGGYPPDYLERERNPRRRHHTEPAKYDPTTAPATPALPLDFQDGYKTSLGQCVYVVPQSIGYKAYGCTYFSATEDCIETPGDTHKPFPYCCPKYRCPGHIASKYKFP